MPNLQKGESCPEGREADMNGKRWMAALLCLAVLSGCAPPSPAAALPCRVVLEEGDGFTCDAYARTVERGGSVEFRLTCGDGWEIVGADYENARLRRGRDGTAVLTLPAVRYSTVVSLTVEKRAVSLYYDPNDGSGEAPVRRAAAPTHLRWNTAGPIFSREGFTLMGWNTAPDGSGTAVELGGRLRLEDGDTLYAQWSPWSDPALFRWEEGADGAVVTACLGGEDTVSVPARLGGLPVRAIAPGAFAGADCRRVVLPGTLYAVEEGAFSGCALRELWLFDSIRTVAGGFDGCGELAVLHLNAAEAPVYSGTYFDTFSDKLDRLLALKDRRKIVLFSGSSVRFGFDCAAIDAAFPGYEVVNMGVYAYTNAMPQMELILACMGPGDVLVHCPEFDASKRQFCTTTDLDAAFFCMTESSYDALARLDLRGYTNVFPALEEYLRAKAGMTAKSYDLSPADFDEDGAPVAGPSYNEYGDYIVHRPNARSEEPIYGLPVQYTVSAFPKERFLDPLNGMYRRFLDRGAAVYFAYSPRNAQAVSEDSTPQARAELDAYLRDGLCVPVITELEDSLWSGVYLYGTDNHLSTQGAALHTERFIPQLRAQMARDGLVDADG